MNTDSISSFSAGLMTGAGLTILTMVGGFFVTSVLIDKTLQEHEQSTVESSHYLQRAQEILDEDVSSGTASPDDDADDADDEDEDE